MPTLKVLNQPVANYVNGSPGTRVMNVLSLMGLSEIEVTEDNDDDATVTYEIPKDWLDPNDIEERLARVGLQRDR